MNVLLLQIDGKLPNVALMRIAAHHRQQGHYVQLQQLRRGETVQRTLFDQWDKVYASAIFTKSQPVVKALLREFPDAIVGGTGWGWQTVEDYGITTKEQDYSIYPSFRASIGFTQRGCRLKCGFCVVPKKEGEVRQEQTIAELWRGDPWPRELLLLDNDFFGQPGWSERIDEIRYGRFKVAFSQGINARMLSEEAAEAIASVDYCDDSMRRKRIYTAWDSIGDEGPLFRGLERLVAHGVKPDEIMVYMLVGYDDSEEDRLYRHRRLREFGCRPYPMPYQRTQELVGFQRWIVGAYDKRFSWEQWTRARYRPERLSA